MNYKGFFKYFASAFMLLIFLTLSSNVFAATITTVHGHSGQIEYMDRVLSDPPYYRGWGLDFHQSPSGPNWIHYSVPVPMFAKTQYMAVVFRTGSEFTNITTIDVFDGSTRIHREAGLNLNGDQQWYILDMGEVKTISSALGISIEVRTVLDAPSHRIWLYSVAVLWEE